ncbi:MAG TPA: glycosyltransferase family A protein [Thermoleophilaceae bacterium]|nr:glycosyltransferase family A protein [Thermoleophilaceae bacterium]
MAAPAEPRIAVAVASHDRALRLRWLLNALEEQTLDRWLWEVVVADDSLDGEAVRVLRSHPLAAAGVLRHLVLPRSEGSAGRLRNAAWREARAPLVAFTDDDCRPPPDWLANALAAAERSPGAIVQGSTRPDPDEVNLLLAPHRHTQWIDPGPYAEACNIVYPRKVLELVGGFREEPIRTGEDTDLALRARAAGAAYAGAPEVLTYHAVEPVSFARRLRGVWRWQDLALLVKRHPSARRHFPMRIFWKQNHGWALLGLAGVAGAVALHPAALALLAPWLWKAQPHYGPSARGRLRALSEAPATMAVDLAEVVALAVGSAKHRTLFL